MNHASEILTLLFSNTFYGKIQNGRKKKTESYEPVFQFQIRHTAELSSVVSYNNEIPRYSLSRDMYIIGADHFPLLFKIRTNFTGFSSVIGAERQDP